MLNSVHNVPQPPPGADSTSAVALERLLDFTGRLAEVMQQGLAERGLTRPRAAVMLQLYRHGPAVQRELSQALGVTPRYITGLVDGLEGDRWVTRGPHPTDRRATMVDLTEQGKAIVTALEVDRRRWAEDLFSNIPAADIAKFTTIVDVLDAGVPRRADDPRCPDTA
jgi:DNA-binding MarR family transcriptional regulator